MKKKRKEKISDNIEDIIVKLIIMIKLTIIMSLIICCVIVAGYKVIEIFSDFESFVQDVIEFAKGLLMFTILFSSLYLFFYWQFMILTKKVFSKI